MVVALVLQVVVAVVHLPLVGHLLQVELPQERLAVLGLPRQLQVQA
jgi:hypothetical protein